MGSLINSNFRVRPSSKFARTVDRVEEYHNYIGYLALSISRVLLIGGKYYKIHIGSAALLNPPPFIATTDGSIEGLSCMVQQHIILYMIGSIDRLVMVHYNAEFM